MCGGSLSIATQKIDEPTERMITITGNYVRLICSRNNIYEAHRMADGQMNDGFDTHARTFIALVSGANWRRPTEKRCTSQLSFGRVRVPDNSRPHIDTDSDESITHIRINADRIESHCARGHARASVKRCRRGRQIVCATVMFKLHV